MKQKLLLLALAILSIGMAKADTEDKNAILVWVDGQSTCYQLADMPKITYSDNCAILTLKGSDKPVLTLPLNGSTVKVTYGEYVPTGINGVKSSNAKVTRNGKFVSGGRLIIIRDGKKYSIDGTEVK